MSAAPTWFLVLNVGLSVREREVVGDGFLSHFFAPITGTEEPSETTEEIGLNR